MLDPRTDKILLTLRELNEMIDAVIVAALCDTHHKPPMEPSCKYCGASVDRDIDGQYECGTAWGARHNDRTEDCLRAELEELRSKPSAADRLNTLLDWIQPIHNASKQWRVSSNIGVRHEYYAGKDDALSLVRAWVVRLLNEIEGVTK